jgi:hypothetical protein
LTHRDGAVLEVAGGDSVALEAQLGALDGVASVKAEPLNGFVRLEVSTPGKDLRPELARLAVQAGANLLRLDASGVNLHELFLKLTAPVAKAEEKVEEAA